MTCGGTGRPPVTWRRNSGMSSSESAVPWARRRTAVCGVVIGFLQSISKDSPQRAQRRTGERKRCGTLCLLWLMFCGMLLHKLAQALHVIDRRLGKNPMPEIEDVSVASSRLFQDILGAVFEFLPVGEQQYRIEVSLHGALMLQPLPAFLEWDAPI